MKRKSIFLLLITFVIMSVNGYSLTETVKFTNFARNSSNEIVTSTVLNTVKVKIYNTSISSYIYEENFASVSVNEFGLFTISVGGGTPVSGTWSAVPYNPLIWVMISLKNGVGDSFLPIQSIALQNLALESKVPIESVGTSEILNGSISNDDISSNALIDVSKLAPGTNGHVVQTVGGAPQWVSIAMGTETDPRVASSTLNRVPKWNGSSLIDGIITDNGTLVSVGGNISASNLSGTNTGDQDLSGYALLSHNHSGVYQPTGTYSTDIHSNISALNAVSGVNTGDQTITLTGDVTGTGTGTIATTISDGAVTNAKVTDVAWSKITGVPSLGAKTIDELTDGISDASNVFLGSLSGTSITTATNNTAIGIRALNSLTTAIGNVAVGFECLTNNNGNYNTAIGMYSLTSNTTASSNTAVGFSSLKSNTTGHNNTATGWGSLVRNTIGYDNTAFGVDALYYNTTGNFNVAVGDASLLENTTGSSNTAVGSSALAGNTTAESNTAIGFWSLKSNTTGSYNTASGYKALTSNTVGSDNTAIGHNALASNTTGSYLTAIGLQALWSNTTGNYNVATGLNAAYSNTTGSLNVSNGYYSLFYNNAGNENTALGHFSGYGSSGVDFNNCTFIGSYSYPTVARTNVTMLGYGITNAQCTGNNQVLLGNTSVAQIRAQVGTITTYSDARFKANIRDDVHGLDFILKLKPVTYNENPEILHNIWGTPDSIVKKIDHSQIKGMRFVGFLAQDVEKAANESGFDFPGIDIPRNTKEVYSLRYGDFIMPIIKAIQEQQAEIERQKEVINELIKRIDKLEATDSN